MKKISKVCTNCALRKNEKALTSVKARIYWVENTGVEPVTSCLPLRLDDNNPYDFEKYILTIVVGSYIIEKQAPIFFKWLSFPYVSPTGSISSRGRYFLKNSQNILFY